MTSSSDACPYCSAVAADTVRISCFKHYWYCCRGCGTMRRQNKDRYPARRVLHLLSRSSLGRKIAWRLFPNMGRLNAESVTYADYGNAFHRVFDRSTGDAFCEFKRRRYLDEADAMRLLLQQYGVDLRDKSVLDVSGGPGTFAHLIRDSVGKIAVSEYDRRAVEAMQGILGDVRVFQADLNSPWADPEVFDVVLYRSCVYFCHDLDRHLGQIKDRVSSGGHVYIHTNMPTLGNVLRWQYEDYTHNVLYHPRTIMGVLHKHGFSVVASGVSDDYSHFLKWFDVRRALYHLWGVWNLLRVNGPRGLDARSFWVLATKNP